MNLNLDVQTPERFTEGHINRIVSFLHECLDKYGDPIEDIQRAVDYALARNGGQGGFIISAEEGGRLIGAIVINKTGMSGYIPENILVYVAVLPGLRGKGVGKKLIKTAMDNCEGDIALHVDRDNPARIMYEQLGFKNAYIEMRWKRVRNSINPNQQ